MPSDIGAMPSDPIPTTTPGTVALDSTIGLRLITATVAGAAVAQLTSTVVNVALPAVANDLAANSAQQQWVVNAYTLALASLILLGGSLGDRFGRVRVFQIGVGLFAAASVLCAIAPTIGVLIAARLVQGVGGALLTPGSLAIVESTLRAEDRSTGVGQLSGLGGIANAIGPVAGGLLIELSWRWVFVINIPIAVLAIVASRGLPESQDPKAAGHSLDFGGAALVAIALGGSAYALIGGPNGSWSATEVTIGVASIIAAVVLFIYERRIRYPMVPVDLFSNRVFVGINLITLIVYGGMGVMLFLLAIELQVALGWSPLAAGAALVPISAIMFALSAPAGAWSGRIGPRVPLTVGPLTIAVGLVMLAFIDPGDSYVTAVLPGVCVFGLGLAATVAPLTSTAMSAVGADRAGVASGFNNAIARMGQLFAIAAIPPLVGLTGDALSDPETLAERFPVAIVVAAVIVAAGGLISWVFLAPTDPTPHRDDAANHYYCAVTSPPPRRR